MVREGVLVGARADPVAGPAAVGVGVGRRALLVLGQEPVLQLPVVVVDVAVGEVLGPSQARAQAPGERGIAEDQPAEAGLEEQGDEEEADPDREERPQAARPAARPSWPARIFDRRLHRGHRRRAAGAGIRRV
jgi:hypothetical protein